jgi:hypothetical protein
MNIQSALAPFLALLVSPTTLCIRLTIPSSLPKSGLICIHPYRTIDVHSLPIQQVKMSKRKITNSDEVTHLDEQIRRFWFLLRRRRVPQS